VTTLSFRNHQKRVRPGMCAEPVRCLCADAVTFLSRYTYSHKALAHIRACLQAHAFLFASRYT